MGTLPPITESDWNQVFEQCRQFPEYQKINKGMSLDEFKGIFYWEYGHRVLGRLIGLVFFIPYLFSSSEDVSKRVIEAQNFFIAFLLGGAQGLLDWYMVKSGLVDQPASESQYRLAAHLGPSFLPVVLPSLDFLGLTMRKRLRVGEP